MLGEVRETGDELIESIVALRASYLYSFCSSPSSSLTLPNELEDALDKLHQLACSWHQALEWLEWFLTVEVPQLPPSQSLLLPPSKLLPTPPPNSLVLLATLTDRITNRRSVPPPPTRGTTPVKASSSSFPSSSSWKTQFLLDDQHSSKAPGPILREVRHSPGSVNDVFSSPSPPPVPCSSSLSSSLSLKEAEWNTLVAAGPPLSARPRAEYLRRLSMGRLVELVDKIEAIVLPTASWNNMGTRGGVHWDSLHHGSKNLNMGSTIQGSTIERHRGMSSTSGSSLTELEVNGYGDAPFSTLEHLYALLFWWKRAARGVFLWPLECCCPPSCVVFLRSYLFKFCRPLLGFFSAFAPHNENDNAAHHCNSNSSGYDHHKKWKKDSSQWSSEAVERHLQSVAASSPILSPSSSSCSSCASPSSFPTPPPDHPVARALRRHLESILLWVEEEVCAVDEVVHIMRSRRTPWAMGQERGMSTSASCGKEEEMPQEDDNTTLNDDGNDCGCCCCCRRRRVRRCGCGPHCSHEKNNISTKSQMAMESESKWEKKNKREEGRERIRSASRGRSTEQARHHRRGFCCCGGGGGGHDCRVSRGSTKTEEEPLPDLQWGRQVVHFSLLSTSPPNVACAELIIPNTTRSTFLTKSMTTNSNDGHGGCGVRGNSSSPSSADFFKSSGPLSGKYSVKRDQPLTYYEQLQFPPHRVCGWLNEAHRRFVKLLWEGLHMRDHQHRRLEHFPPPPPPSSLPTLWIHDDNHWSESDDLPAQNMEAMIQYHVSLEEDDEEEEENQNEEVRGATATNVENKPIFYYSLHVRRMTRMVFRAWKAYQVVLFLGTTSSSPSSSSSSPPALLLYATRAVQLAHRALHYYYSVMEKILMKTICREIPLTLFFPPPQSLPVATQDGQTSPPSSSSPDFPSVNPVTSLPPLLEREVGAEESETFSFSSSPKSSLHSILSPEAPRRTSLTNSMISSEKDVQAKKKEETNVEGTVGDPSANNSDVGVGASLPPSSPLPIHAFSASSTSPSVRPSRPALSGTEIVLTKNPKPSTNSSATSSKTSASHNKHKVTKKSSRNSSPLPISSVSTSTPPSYSPAPKPEGGAEVIGVAKQKKGEERKTAQDGHKNKMPEPTSTKGKNFSCANTLPDVHGEDKSVSVLIFEQLVDSPPTEKQQEEKVPPTPVVLPISPPSPRYPTHLFFNANTISLLARPEMCAESHLLWFLRQLTMMMLWISPYALEEEGRCTMKMAALAASTAMATTALVPANTRLAAHVKQQQEENRRRIASKVSSPNPTRESLHPDKEEEKVKVLEMRKCASLFPVPPPLQDEKEKDEEPVRVYERRKGTQLMKRWCEIIVPPPGPPAFLRRHLQRSKRQGGGDDDGGDSKEWDAYLPRLHISSAVKAYVDHYQRDMIRWRREVDARHAVLANFPLMDDILQCSTAVRSVVVLLANAKRSSPSSSPSLSLLEAKEESASGFYLADMNEEEEQHPGCGKLGGGISHPPAFSSVYLSDTDSDMDNGKEGEGEKHEEESADGGEASLRKRREDKKKKKSRRISFVDSYDCVRGAWREMAHIRQLVGVEAPTTAAITTTAPSTLAAVGAPLLSLPNFSPFPSRVSPFVACVPPAETSSPPPVVPSTIEKGQGTLPKAIPIATTTTAISPTSATIDKNKNMGTTTEKKNVVPNPPALSTTGTRENELEKDKGKVDGGNGRSGGKAEKEKVAPTPISPPTSTTVKAKKLPPPLSSTEVSNVKVPAAPAPTASGSTTATSTVVPARTRTATTMSTKDKHVASDQNILTSTTSTAFMTKKNSAEVVASAPSVSSSSPSAVSSKNNNSNEKKNIIEYTQPQPQQQEQQESPQSLLLASDWPKSSSTFLKNYSFPNSSLARNGGKELDENTVVPSPPPRNAPGRTTGVPSSTPAATTNAQPAPVVFMKPTTATAATTMMTRSTTSIWKRSLTAPPGFYHLHETENICHPQEEVGPSLRITESTHTSPFSFYPSSPPHSLLPLSSRFPPLLPFSPSPLFYLFSLLRRTEVIGYESLRRLCQLVFLAGVVYQRTLWHIRTKRFCRPPPPPSFPPPPSSSLFLFSLFSSKRGKKYRGSSALPLSSSFPADHGLGNSFWSYFALPEKSASFLLRPMDGVRSAFRDSASTFEKSTKDRRVEKEEGEEQEDEEDIVYPGCFSLLDVALQLVQIEVENIRVTQPLLLPNALALQSLTGLFSWVGAAASSSVPYACSPFALSRPLHSVFPSYSPSSLFLRGTSPSPILLIQSLLADVLEQVYQIRGRCQSVLHYCYLEEESEIKRQQQQRRKRQEREGRTRSRKKERGEIMKQIATHEKQNPPQRGDYSPHSSSPPPFSSSLQREREAEVTGRNCRIRNISEVERMETGKGRGEREGDNPYKVSFSIRPRPPSQPGCVPSAEKESGNKKNWNVHEKRQWAMKHQWWLEGFIQASAFFIQTECPLPVATPIGSSFLSSTSAVQFSSLHSSLDGGGGSRGCLSASPQSTLSSHIDTNTVDLVPWGEWWLPEPEYLPKPKVFLQRSPPPPPPPPASLPPLREPSLPPPPPPPPPAIKKPSPPPPPPPAEYVHKKSTYARRGKGSFSFDKSAQRPGSKWIEKRGKFEQLDSTEAVVKKA